MASTWSSIKTILNQETKPANYKVRCRLPCDEATGYPVQGKDSTYSTETLQIIFSTRNHFKTEIL